MQMLVTPISQIIKNYWRAILGPKFKDILYHTPEHHYQNAFSNFQFTFTILVYYSILNIMDQALNKLVDLYAMMFDECKKNHIINNNMMQQRINKLELKKQQLKSVVGNLESTNKVSREQLALQNGQLEVLKGALQKATTIYQKLQQDNQQLKTKKQ